MTTIEYAIMLVLVGLAVSAFGIGLGGSVDSVFSRMVQSLTEKDSQPDGHPDKTPVSERGDRN